MTIPLEIQEVIDKLQTAEFESFVVGGSVRDLLLKKKPKDWDVATKASPAEIQKIFTKSFYNNNFGTVTVLTNAEDPTVKEVEITTYRTEAEYSDQRHPDKIGSAETLEEDLARRDFTVNALALAGDKADTGSHENMVSIEGMKIIDPFGGLKDLNAQLIRAVGEPRERFNEDALRLMRAVRFATQLDFVIEENTFSAISELRSNLAVVSQERIRDELVKLVESARPEYGFSLLRRTGLLKYILPEVTEGIEVEQNKHHIYTVYDHNVKSLQWAAKYGYPLHIRLAALLHDIGKPRTKRLQGNEYIFHAHEIVGTRMAEKALRRLHFSNDVIDQVVRLIRYHMFYYDVGKVTDAGARRLLRRVGGPAVFADLIKLRIAERKGSGVPKAEPYRLRHLQFLVEKAAQEPTSVKQLKIGGQDIIEELAMRPGPVIGGILNALLAEVLDDPTKNERGYLLERAQELKDVDPVELKELGEAAKEEEEKRKENDIRRKYDV